MSFQEDEPLSKDLFFDVESKPTSVKAQQATDKFIELFLLAEETFAPRKRARRVKDELLLKQQLAAILGNLVRGYARKKPTPIAIPLSNQLLGRRNSHPILNDKLAAVLTILDKHELIHLIKGSYSSKKQTTIEAESKVIDIINELGLTRRDFKVRDRAPIILRACKTAEEKRRGRPGKELALPDSEEVKRLEMEVTRINAYLAGQSIQYVGDRDGIDDERLASWRVFNNGSLTDGGRLYGGFWQQLSGKKEASADEREDDITINGEHLVGLDYGQIAVRLLYSFEGAQMALEDAYALPGWEGSRDGIKKFMNAMINDATGSPKAVRTLFKDKPGLRVDELTQAVKMSILEHHAPVKHHFDGRSTYRLTFEESTHLVNLLLELVDLNIPALPVHDCLYVRLSDQDTVRRLMINRFEERFNINVSVQ